MKQDADGQPADQAAVAATTHSVLFDLKQLTRFDEQHPQATILADTGDALIVLLGMRLGQAVAEATTPSQLIAQCLRGRAVLHIGTSAQALRAGLVVLVEANTPHSFTATTDCVLLLTLTPSPEQLSSGHTLLMSQEPLVKRS